MRVKDLADLYVRALDARAGARYIAVSESVRLADIAAALAAPQNPDAVAPWSLEEARAQLGDLADALALDQRLSSARARRELSWETTRRSATAELATIGAISAGAPWRPAPPRRPAIKSAVGDEPSVRTVLDRDLPCVSGECDRDPPARRRGFEGGREFTLPGPAVTGTRPGVSREASRSASPARSRCAHEQVEALFGVVGPESVAAGERRKAVQGAPDDLGVGVDVTPGERCERLSQFGEGVLEWGGLVGLGEGKLGEGEHRVVESGPSVSEVEVGAREGEQRAARRSRRGPGVAQRLGKSGEPIEGHGPDDRALAGEVAVEDRLAVLDRFGQTSGRHRVPAFCFGECECGADDQLLALLPLASSTILNRHHRRVRGTRPQAASLVAIQILAVLE